MNTIVIMISEPHFVQFVRKNDQVVYPVRFKDIGNVNVGVEKILQIVYKTLKQLESETFKIANNKEILYISPHNLPSRTKKFLAKYVHSEHNYIPLLIGLLQNLARINASRFKRNHLAYFKRKIYSNVNKI